MPFLSVPVRVPGIVLAVMKLLPEYEDIVGYGGTVLLMLVMLLYSAARPPSGGRTSRSPLRPAFPDWADACRRDLLAGDVLEVPGA